MSGRPLIFGAQVVSLFGAHFFHAGRSLILAARSSPYLGAELCYARALFVMFFPFGACGAEGAAF